MCNICYSSIGLASPSLFVWCSVFRDDVGRVGWCVARWGMGCALMVSMETESCVLSIRGGASVSELWFI